MTIRKLRQHDGPLLDEFFASLGPRTRRFYQPRGGLMQGSSTVAERWDNLDQLHLVSSVEENGQEVALAYGFLWSLRSPAPWLGICVRDRAQNQGLGSFLMEQLIRRAIMMGKSQLRLTVLKENSRAIHVYRRLGFQTCGEDRDGQWIMERQLPPPRLAERIAWVDARPGGIPGVTPDTWSLITWRRHLARLREMGANGVAVRLLPARLFHQSWMGGVLPRSSSHVLTEMLARARDCGLRPFLSLGSLAALPGPEQVCWRRAKEDASAAYHRVVSQFKNDCDGFFLELQEPGCDCQHCRRPLQALVEMVQEFHSSLWRTGRPLRLNVVGLSLGQLESQPGSDPTGRLLSLLPLESMVAAESASLLLAALRRKRRPLSCPNSSSHRGLEIFPRLQAGQIERWAESSLAAGWAGALLGQRFPSTRWVSDYLAFRKLADPAAGTATLMDELAACWVTSLACGQAFTRAHLALDQWWEHHQVDALEEAHRLMDEALGGCAQDDLQLVEPAAELTGLLAELVRHQGSGRADRMVELMKSKRTFHSWLNAPHGQQQAAAWANRCWEELSTAASPAVS